MKNHWVNDITGLNESRKLSYLGRKLMAGRKWFRLLLPLMSFHGNIFIFFNLNFAQYTCYRYIFPIKIFKDDSSFTSDF